MQLPLNKKNTWLITGVAGFIGSHLLESLLSNGQKVIGIDSFVTGSENNLDHVRSLVGNNNWKNFKFYKEDIRDLSICRKLCKRSDYVLHQAALGSVPRSIKDPLTSHDTNINGFLNILQSVKLSEVKKIVFASSSSVYGDHKSLPKLEGIEGRLLSPYATTKKVNEMYAQVFGDSYGLNYAGLRYFNVFGERQDPNGPYAAVIPKWIDALFNSKEVFINGDGKTSRDFCYVKNVVQANIMAALTTNKKANNQIFNIACGERTTLNRLFKLLKSEVQIIKGVKLEVNPIFQEFRDGDVRHSHANISKARKLIKYSPKYLIEEGLSKTVPWFIK